jgi:hypothetical protein
VTGGGQVEARADLEARAATGGWPALPRLADDEKLELGDEDASWVPALRGRLAASGDLDPAADAAAPESARVDESLAEAVRRFQRRHGLDPDGVVGRATAAALGVPIAERLRQIDLNLERRRALPPSLGERFLLVNLPAFELEAIEAGRRDLAMKWWSAGARPSRQWSEPPRGAVRAGSRQAHARNRRVPAMAAKDSPRTSVQQSEWALIVPRVAQKGETAMQRFISRIPRLVVAALLVAGAGATASFATEPCGDFGECKALIEINATDGDIGFHFLMDGDDLNSARIRDPNGVKVFEDQAKGPLLEQKLTETFAESAEPLCWDDPEADEDEEIVTLEEFLGRWPDGTYTFEGMGDGGEKSEGETELTFDLPAAPQVFFNGSEISWLPGEDLGNCGSYSDLADLVTAGVLDTHPEDVPVVAWEAVIEADGSKLTFRVPASVSAVTVPPEWLAAFEADTPGKIEVGAIGVDDNATFTEEEVCLNEDEGCEDEE